MKGVARFNDVVGRLVAHAEAGASGEHACCNVHGEEFLKEKFGGVRDMDLGNAGFVVTGPAFV